ncbi:Dehydrodolichyl diphosphate synthase 5 [Capsicum chinense]|nr:Dehydrodolichyl diphosphate synthase 5 [Capsicum chinense]
MSVIGDRFKLPITLQKGIELTEEATKSNEGLHLLMALNYGGHYDMVQATKSIATKVKDGVLLLEQADNKLLEQELATKCVKFARPDLLIRTGRTENQRPYFPFNIDTDVLVDTHIEASFVSLRLQISPLMELKESSRESKESQRKQLSFNTGCLLRSGDVYMEILEDNLLKYGTLRKSCTDTSGVYVTLAFCSIIATRVSDFGPRFPPITGCRSPPNLGNLLRSDLLAGPWIGNFKGIFMGTLYQYATCSLNILPRTRAILP